MRRLIFFLVLSCMPAALALAQSGSSRLDEIVKSGKLRVCTPGDYKPFSFLRPDGAYEGLDIDLVQASAKALGVEVDMVKSAWPTLMKDFIDKCDVAVGGISVTLDRQKTAFFTAPYMVNGKAPITKCENAAKFQTVADIDKPGVTVIENPGGSNERFARELQAGEDGEMAWLLPRGDPALKAWMDQWFHLAKAGGDYDRITGKWLR